MSIELLFSLILVSFCSFQEVQSVTCTYVVVDSVYTCRLNNQNIQSDSDTEEILGNHLPDRIDTDVLRLESSRSTILVFPSMIIEKFVNLEVVILNSSGMTTIQRRINSCANLKHVSLNSNAIMSLPAGIFQNCNKITYLSITINMISEIHDDAFAGLSELKSLILLSNLIKTINRSWLEPLSSLTALVLDFNALTAVESSALQAVPELRQLDLQFNRITSWSNEILQQNRWIERLLLHGNEIESIAASSFSNLPNLRTLSVGNQLRTLPSGWNLPRVETLTLDANFLTTVNAATFSVMPNLKTLQINRNQLLTLDFTDRSPKVLRALEVLSVQSNNITELPGGSFSVLINLKRLNLRSNRISKLTADAIVPILPLEILDVSNNIISEIDREIFTNVVNLDFRAEGNLCVNRNIKIESSLPEGLLENCFSSGWMVKVNISIIALAMLFLIRF